MPTFKEQVQIDEPNFRGIALHDAVPLQTIQNLGVTMAWILSAQRVNCINNLIRQNTNVRVLIAGNDKECHPCYHPRYNTNNQHDCIGCHDRIDQKGLYFIADIVEIKNCLNYVRNTGGMADSNFRAHHCFINYPTMTWDVRRHAIYFTNASVIRNFSMDFNFTQRPTVYIPTTFCR